MQISEYAEHVRESDQALDRADSEREDIYLYGLASELGALVAEIRRKLRWDENSSVWNVPNESIKAELGDALWYCFAIAALRVGDGAAGLLNRDVRNLRKSLAEDDQRAQLIRAALDKKKTEEFLADSEAFKASDQSDLDAYQKLAYLTARTKDQVLLEVCLVVLWQLGAELLRRKLPEVERRINQSMPDRDLITIVGEIVWHLCALATLYKVTLSSIAELNSRKVEFRRNRKHPTPLHDDAYPHEQFPRKFQVSFVRVAEGRSRMYLAGRRLGDDLTDNAHDEDGYRFHDVLHLANIAKLGWSPVFRGLMKKKRKSNAQVDEVEDGARAQIAEEAVVKFIHGEGMRLAKQKHPNADHNNLSLYTDTSYISHALLSSVRDQVRGLEVEQNKFWEWSDCILSGYEVFNALRKEHQGTISIDLSDRTILFEPDVELDIPGVTAGVGAAAAEITPDTSGTEALLSKAELADASTPRWIAATIAAKKALLFSIGIFDPHEEEMKLLDVKLKYGNRLSFRAGGHVLAKMWELRVVTFKVAFVQSATSVSCTALALIDPSDVIGSR